MLQEHLGRSQTEGVGRTCTRTKFCSERNAEPSGKRETLAIESAQSFERRVYNETAKRVARGELFRQGKRKFSDGAEGTHGEAKRRGIFSAEAETSCNAEAKKGIKAEPRAVGSSRMMVFTHKLRKRESALGRIGAYFAQSF